MKRSRIIFIILWILSLVGISFFGGPVSYGIFAALSLLPVFSLAYVICVFFLYRIYQELDNRSIVAGRMTPFYFTLVNEYFPGFCSIRVSFFSGFSSVSGIDDDTEYELLPGTGIKKQTSLVCRYRGEYEVGIKTVEIRDYFRLIRLRFHNRETLRVTVKPDLVTLDELRCADLSQTTAKDNPMNRTEPDVIVRKYDPGDDLRHINWKASARAGELLTRRMTGEEREGVYILMGTKRFSDDQAVFLPLENKMLELTLALGLFFVKKNIMTNVCYMQKSMSEHALASLDRFDALYEAVCTVEFRESADEHELLTAASGLKGVFSCRTAFLVLHEWNDRVLQFVHLLRENSVFAVVCLVTDEPAEEASAAGIPGMKLIRIGTDTPLKEAGL